MGSPESSVLQFWKAYAARNRASGADFAVWRFGDSRELANELVALVTGGTKRAKSDLLRDFAANGKPLPGVGDFSVVLDGDATPRCIVRTVQVDVKPLNEVDVHFAWLEGEGDRSLDWWLTAHLRYFTRQGAREGFRVSDSTEVVLTQFEVVWPPEFADVQPQIPENDAANRRQKG